jgi:glucosaminylphosphatidylinositol acyltransferase
METLGNDYKLQKEAWVTGLNGTSLWETSLIVLASPIGVACQQILLYLLNLLIGNEAFDKLDFRFKLLIEFLPITFIYVSIFTDYIFTIISCLLSLLVVWSVYVTVVTNRSTSKTLTNAVDSVVSSFKGSKRPIAISNYRAAMMVMTCVAILSVDFPIFPRRFAKTESFGFSPMDIGVGSFIFASALVSKDSRDCDYLNRNTFKARFLEIIESTRTLIFLGLFKFFTHWFANYQVHVSEYGVHWNFFLTLAFVPLLSLTAILLTNSLHFPRSLKTWLPMAIGLFLSANYEFILQSNSSTFQNYVLSNSRSSTSFLNQNREGILGLIGFTSIHLAGISCGRFIFHERKDTANTSLFRYFLVLLILFSVFLSLFFFNEAYLSLETSRRLVNMQYVLFTMFINIATIFLFELLEYFHGIIWNIKLNTHVHSKTLELINKHSLVFFFVANLLVGLVNVSVVTLETDDSSAFIILTGYISLVICMTYVIDSLH